VADSFWTLDRIAKALEPQAQVNLPRGSRTVNRVTTDTRTIEPGDLFVALKGERFDAHDFLGEAVSKGAAAVVVSEAPKLGELNVPVFEVKDTLVALGLLASFWRNAWGPGKTIVAVAGSNGKTSTKDLIRAALSGTYRVHSTTGNLNNRIGVPLTLLAIPPDAELAIIELGTSLPGEVAILRDIVQPEIVVVTSIAEEHLEGLGDLGGVLREEAAAYDGAAVGIAPAEQPEIAAAARGKVKKLVIAGLDAGFDLSPDSWRLESDGTGHVELDGIRISPPLRGIHNLRNTMLALAVAQELGVPLTDSRKGIEAMQQPNMRTAWTQVGRLTLINDAYNANPGSTRAAIQMLAGADKSRQRVIVLGTMRELGATSNQLHDEIITLALASGADVVAGIGDFASALERSPYHQPQVVTASDVDDLWPKLQSKLKPDAIILLKASRGVQLERLVPHLTTWANA
jgi:UDP-N-acetylmuramoyl-tripeptide--D-alanyl-D-alanine ligase